MKVFTVTHINGQPLYLAIGWPRDLVRHFGLRPLLHQYAIFATAAAIIVELAFMGLNALGVTHVHIP